MCQAVRKLTIKHKPSSALREPAESAENPSIYAALNCVLNSVHMLFIIIVYPKKLYFSVAFGIKYGY